MAKYPSQYTGQNFDTSVRRALSEFPGQISTLNTKVAALEEDVDDLSALPQQVATIGLKLGDLTELETADKTDLVSAINEVKYTADGGIYNLIEKGHSSAMTLASALQQIPSGKYAIGLHIIFNLSGVGVVDCVFTGTSTSNILNENYWKQVLVFEPEKAEINLADNLPTASTYYINNGVWATRGGQVTYFFSLSEYVGRTLTVQGRTSGSNNVSIAFLTDDSHVTGETPSFDTTMNTERILLPAGSDAVTYVIPSTSKYLYVFWNYGTAYYNPSVLKIEKFVSDDSYVKKNEMIEAFPVNSDESEEDSDLDIVDEDDKVLVRFSGGHIKTKWFDSSKIGGIDFQGAKISILGDSISTFGVDGSTGDSHTKVGDGNSTYLGNHCRYPTSYLTQVTQMWWRRLIDNNGMVLGVNESWAGSRVSWDGTTESGDIGADKHIASVTRISHLGGNGTPDYIFVYAGTNDAGAGVELGTFNTESPINYTEEQIAALPVATFADAFRTMLIRLQYYYRTSKVIVMFPNYVTSYYTIGNLDQYVEIEREACDFFGVPYIDLRTSGITIFNRATYLGDGVHPNSSGMELLYKRVLKDVAYKI